MARPFFKGEANAQIGFVVYWLGHNLSCMTYYLLTNLDRQAKSK